MISAVSPAAICDRAFFYGGPSLDLPDATQARRHGSDIGSPYCKSIARGARKWREIAVGAQVFGKHQTERVQQRQHLGLGRRERRSVLLNRLSRFGK